MISLLKKYLSSLFLVFSFGACFGQIENLNFEYSNLIEDTIRNDNGVIMVYYYSNIEKKSYTKRGHKLFNNGILYEYSWTSQDGLFSVGVMNFDNEKTSFVNVSFKGAYRYIMNYYENGSLKNISNYDENDLEHGWTIELNEDGTLIEKKMFEHGKLVQ